MKKSILIIDDDPTNHLIIEKLLTHSGKIANILKAFNGMEALKIMNNYCQGVIKNIDLILLDINMPLMDGFEFMEHWKSLSCYTKSMEVVIITSSLNTRDKIRAKNLDIDYYLTKPLTEHQLLKLLSTPSKTIL